MNQHREFSGVIFAVFAAVGFSAKAILIKLAYIEQVDAITLLALRMAFALPFFVVAAVWINRKNSIPLSQKDWIAVVVLGLLGYYLSSLLDFLGLLYITAGLERLILFLYPTMTVILSSFIFKRPLGRKVIAAMALSYAGIVLVFLHDVNLSQEKDAISQTDVMLGAGLVFASTLSYSSYLIGAGQVIVRIGATRFTAYASIVACLAAILQFLLVNPLAALQLPARVYELSIAMAVFSTVMPVFLLSYAIKRIGSGSSSLIGSIGPVVTIVLAYVFLNEDFSLLQIAGSALVLLGVLIVSLNSRKIQIK